MESLLGEGSYGQVYRYGEKQVIKVEPIDLEYGVSDSSIREISALNMIKHSNVIELDQFFFDQRGTNLVLPYYDGDLQRFIWNNLLMAKKVCYQIALGLCAIHDHGWLHRDLKPGNILYQQRDLDPHVVIADFGQSLWSIVKCLFCRDIVGTVNYQAPELLLEVFSYGAEIDIWSLGLIYLYILSGGVTIPGKSDEEQLSLYFTFFGPPSDEETRHYFDGLLKENFAGPVQEWYTPVRPPGLLTIGDAVSHNIFNQEVADLILRICRYHPRQRPSAREILSFAFFDEVRDLYPRPPESLALTMKLSNGKLATMSNLIRLSQSFPQISNFSIDLKIRRSLYTWLLQVHDTSHLGYDVFQNACMLLDLYINATGAVITKLFAMATLIISIKLLTEQDLEITDYVYALGKGYNTNQIVTAMKQILEKVEQPAIVTPNIFLRLVHHTYTKSVAVKVELILTASLIEGLHLTWNSERLAYAALLYIAIHYSEEISIEEILDNSRYTRAELEVLFPEITASLEQVDKSTKVYMKSGI